MGSIETFIQNNIATITFFHPSSNSFPSVLLQNLTDEIKNVNVAVTSRGVLYKDLKEKSKSEFKNDHGTDTRSFFSHTSATGVCSLLILHTEKQNTQAATTYKIFPYSMAYVIIVAEIKT